MQTRTYTLLISITGDPPPGGAVLAGKVERRLEVDERLPGMQVDVFDGDLTCEAGRLTREPALRLRKAQELHAQLRGEELP
jgi:hypothetical protein